VSTPPGFVVRNGVRLRGDPAREACFTVVHSDAEMQEWPDMSLRSRRERLHRHMNNEVGSLEIAAQMLVDFPDAPWELRMQLARQCWDETRHVQLLHRRLLELGGRKGEFPVSNFEWSVTCAVESLAGRLAVQNRTFEAGQMDIVGKVTGDWRAAGDGETADVLEGILADEIQHVRFANQWIRRLAAEDKRVLLGVAVAVRFLAAATAALAEAPGTLNAAGVPIGDPRERVPRVNVEDRRRAGFSEEEIHEVLRQAGFRSLVPSRGPGAGEAP
jgi:uncharacterized ferritin-like protein (DUF455 family)